MSSNPTKIFVRPSADDPTKHVPFNIFIEDQFNRASKVGDLFELIEDHGGNPLMAGSALNVEADVVLVKYGSQKLPTWKNRAIEYDVVSYTWVTKSVEAGVLLDIQGFRVPTVGQSRKRLEIDPQQQMDEDVPSIDNNSSINDTRSDVLVPSTVPPQSIPARRSPGKDTHRDNEADGCSTAAEMPTSSPVAAIIRPSTVLPAPPKELSSRAPLCGIVPTLSNPCNNSGPGTGAGHSYSRPRSGPQGDPKPELSRDRRQKQDSATKSSQGETLFEQQDTAPTVQVFRYDSTGRAVKTLMHVLESVPKRDAYIEMVVKHGGIHVDLKEAELVFIHPDYEGTYDVELLFLGVRLLTTDWIERSCEEGYMLPHEPFFGVNHIFKLAPDKSDRASARKGKERIGSMSKAARRPAIRRANPSTSSSSKSTSSSSKSTSRSGKKYTKEDFQLVTEYISTHPHDPTEVTWTEFWTEFSRNHAQHSAEEWKGFVRRHTSRLKANQLPGFGAHTQPRKKRNGPQGSTWSTLDDQDYIDMGDEEEEDESRHEEDMEVDELEDDLE